MQQALGSSQDRAISTREAADMCGVSELTIKRNLDRIGSFTIGRARRIWLSDLIAFAARRAEEERAAKAGKAGVA